MSQAADVLAPIFAADLAKLPAPRPLRAAYMKEQAAAIRALFRGLGVRGVSVTIPRGSMCFWVDVRLPVLPDCPARTSGEGPADHRARCRDCARRAAARRRVAYIIHAAFTDLDNRSDSRSDYSDNPVHVE